jgi:hypothetical protein
MRRIRITGGAALLCCGLILLPKALLAAESVDCSNDSYAIRVVCGFESCTDFNFYIRSEIQDSSRWREERLNVSMKARTVSFLAKGARPDASDIELDATGEQGILRYGGSTYAVMCDWSAVSR